MMGMFRRSVLAGVLAATACWGQTGIAAEVAAPKGSVVLTVAGKIDNWNRGAMSAERDSLLAHHKIAFDKAMTFDADTLGALPTQELKVTVAGTETVYSGPLLYDVLVAAGAQPGPVKLVSLDGSSVELSADDVKNRSWMLALLVNGAKVGIGDFGPLWLMHKPEKDATPSKEELQDWVSSVFYIELK
jgi:hypothetical protein